MWWVIGSSAGEFGEFDGFGESYDMDGLKSTKPLGLNLKA